MSCVWTRGSVFMSGVMTFLPTAMPALSKMQLQQKKKEGKHTTEDMRWYEQKGPSLGDGRDHGGRTLHQHEAIPLPQAEICGQRIGQSLAEWIPILSMRTCTVHLWVRHSSAAHSHHLLSFFVCLHRWLDAWHWPIFVGGTVTFASCLQGFQKWREMQKKFMQNIEG